MMRMIILCLLLSLVPRGFASVYFVNQSISSLSCANGVCGSIRAALSVVANNDTIYLLPGYYSGVNNTDLCFVHDCVFRGVSLIGFGAAEEIVLVGGTASSRGVNASHRSFTYIANLTFTGFRADHSGGAGLYARESVLTAENVIFRNNSATFGGAMATVDCVLSLLSVIIDGNYASSFGGGLSAISSNVTISRCSLVNNEVSSANSVLMSIGSGGAIYFLGTQDCSLVISKSSFSNNSADRSGGALHLEPSGSFSSAGSVSVTDSSFTRNQLRGVSSCLTSSSCNAMGGAVYVSAAGMVFENCDFRSNYAFTSSSTSNAGQGGAIYSTTIYVLKSKASLTVRSCNFSSNGAAGEGGALYISNQHYNIQKSGFYDNVVYSPEPSFSTVPSQGGAIWFSDGALKGIVTSCIFSHNTARGGWGGAIYAASSSTLTLHLCSFLSNSAVSSYTYAALGGALMLSNKASVVVNSSTFTLNFAQPNFTTVPLTYSGAGGAIYAQSVSLKVISSAFVSNAAYTGQFDAGATGGAIVLEDCQPMTITNSRFFKNFAAGYVGTSSYASSGNGGALYIKFSVANVEQCEFVDNWVSAGEDSSSMGGAIAVFFDYSSVAESSYGIQINNTVFLNNSAFGQLCSGVQTGIGGAVGIVGVAKPPVVFYNVTFGDNIAVGPKSNRVLSIGGALVVSLESNVSFFDVHFVDNFALYGVGNDVGSVTVTEQDSNYMYFYNCGFAASTTSVRARIVLANKAMQDRCNQLTSFVDNYYTEDLVMRRRLETEQPLSLQHDAHATKRSMHALPSLKRHSHLAVQISIDPGVIGAAVMDIFPGVFFSSGSSTLERCYVDGKYHIFLANLAAIEDAQSGNDPIDAQSWSKVNILGGIQGSELAFTLLSSTLLVELYSESDTVWLRELNVFNGTILFANDIYVSQASFLFATKFVGVSSSYWDSLDTAKPFPSIEFEDDLYTGYSLIEALSSGQISLVEFLRRRFRNSTITTSAQSVLTFDSCNAVISGKLMLDSPFRGVNTYVNISDGLNSIPNCKLELRRNATFIVAATGSLFLFTSTSIIADSLLYPAVVNDGFVSLVGVSGNPSSRSKVLSSVAELGSLTSILTVFGQFTQNATGQLHLVLNSSGQSIPVVNLMGEYDIQGQINVSFNGNPSLELYDTNTPSSFAIMSFSESAVASSTLMPTIIAPVGLDFKNEIAFSDKTSRYQQQLVVENIACEQINTDYRGVASSLNSNLYPCYICLQNSSCELCESDVGGYFCAMRGKCGVGASTAFTSQCCSSSCNSPYGHCKGSDGNTQFSCECSGWFYTGNNCDELSIYAIIIIFSGTFLVTTAILGVFLYRRSLSQKQQVLEELREGILRHTESANNEYILNMQQALILNDVFVKFDEIKLESKVGEGSFGIVHKATFRGAQVAVKQMRSMFFELTDKEIDEFRREAYVMSRLRHPNIVLVMGISLMDSEPVVLPKTRTITSCDESIDVSDKKKAKPQKTVCIITEFLEQGSLADILYGPTRLPAEIWTYELILACALQAARGMLYLHSHQPPICHRDLKSSNLVVDDHWVVKVTDFGMSRIVPEKMQDFDIGLGEDPRESIGRDSIGDVSSRHEAGSIMIPSGPSNSAGRKNQSQASSSRPSFSGAPEMTSNMGTTAWCAPEILTASNRARYSVKVDVYSFGMVLWELWEKKRPFEEYSSRFDIMDAVRAGKRPAISEGCPPAFKALIQRCWHAEPSRRPMFHYIVRYLKDELARVKRQKALPSAPFRNSTAFFRSSFVGYGSDSQQNRPAQQVSAPAVVERDSRDNSSVQTVVEKHDGDIVSPIHDADATSPQEKQTLRNDSNTETNDIHFPEGRTPLVKAFDRGLSYLTESPALSSPILERHIAAGQSNFLPSQIYGRSSAFGRDFGATPQVPTSNNAATTTRLSLTNNWRDRYVMRFSGWNSTKPDAGLPPSLLTGPNGSSSSTASLAPESVQSTDSQEGSLDDRKKQNEREAASDQSQTQLSSPVDSSSFVPTVFKLDPEQGQEES